MGFFVLSFSVDYLLLGTRVIMALGKQGKIKKRNVMVFFFYLQKVNGTYHDWLVIIGSQTRTQTLFMVFVG